MLSYKLVPSHLAKLIKIDFYIFIYLYFYINTSQRRVFALSRNFLENAKNFRLVRKCIYKHFYGNHPNDSLKVIDEIMGLCIKITWCKNHDILFGQCENVSKINFLYGGQPNGTPKHLPLNISNIFPYQHFILALRNCIHK